MFIQMINGKLSKYPSTFTTEILLSWKQAKYLLDEYFKENAS